MSFWSGLKDLFRPQPPVVAFAPDDADHQAAKIQARLTLPSFWRAHEEHGEFGDFLIKVGFPAANEGLEHVWLGRIRREPTGLRGVLENQPAHTLRRMTLGDEVEFSEDQVSDWAYRKGDLWFGHFTTRVMLQHPDSGRLPPDVAAEIKATLSETATET